MINWLARYATRVAVRRVVTILVLSLLAWAGIGRAEAVEVGSRQEAYAACQARRAEYIATGQAIGNVTCEIGSAGQQAYFCYRYPFWPGTSGRVSCPSPNVWSWTEECPAGQDWDDSTKTCTTECGSDGWADPTNPGQCLNQQKCLARNADLGSAAGQPRTSLTTCRDVGGCEFAFSSTGHDTIEGNFGPNGERTSAYRGVMEYTGNPGSACGVPPEIDPDWNDSEVSDPADQKCMGVAGQTLCVNQHGEHCYEAASNRFICWKPRETGEKTDMDHKQKRDAGDQPIPPQLQLPNGDQLEPKGTPKEVTYRDAQGNEIKTVTVNYQTVNGTSPSGGKNEGQNKDGSGQEGDEEQGRVSGGDTCTKPPVVSGGDPLMGEQIRQQWYSRCGDGTDPTPKQSDYLGDGDGEPTGGSWHEFGGDISLDTSGMGYANSCPSLPTVQVMGQTISFNTSVFCDWMHLGGWFVLLLTSLWCGRLIVSS